MYYNILVQWQKVTTLVVVVSIVKKGGREREREEMVEKDTSGWTWKEIDSLAAIYAK